MCKCNQNNKCSCNQNPCGCEKIDAKCVLYNGVCLSNLGICADTDLEEIIIIIDGLIQDILEQIEQAWTAANIGGGAEMYKGISSLGIHQFRTLIDSVSVKLTQNANNISLSVDEDWLLQIITDILENLPGTNITSPLSSINITNTGSDFGLDIDPSTFTSPDSSVNISSTTAGGELRITMQVNPSYIEGLFKDVVNIGTGADIYKGLNGNSHEFRGITTNVTQPTNPGQLQGNISATSAINGDNVQISLNFSSLRVSPQTFGIPEYYVNAANPEDGDGSSVSPYKTWELCKTAIGGTVNTSRNVKVIFQSNITSGEDMTLNGVDYVFQNNSIFTYTGTGAIIDYSLFTGSTYKSITLSGKGGVQQQTHISDTLNAISVIGGDGVNFSRALKILGDITVYERSRISDPSTSPASFTLVDRRDEAGQPVYGYNEAFSKGTVYVSGKNIQGEALIQIAPGGSLTIRDRINTTIEATGSGVGFSGISVEGTLSLLHIGNYYRYSSVGGTSPNTYLIYSDIIPRVLIQNGYTITFNNGVFKASHGGSSNSGGYSSLVKLTGQSSLDITRDSRLIVDSDLFYKYLFEVSDDTTIKINNISSSTRSYSGTNPLLNCFYASASAAPTIEIDFGKIHWNGGGDFKNTNITTTPYTYWVFVNGTPVSASMPTTPSANIDNDIYTSSGVLTRD